MRCPSKEGVERRGAPETQPRSVPSSRPSESTGWNESRREDKANEVVAAAVKQGVGVVQDV